MQQIASELLLLTTNLSQIKNRDRLIQLFLESISSIFSGYRFDWFTDDDDRFDELFIPVCTRRNSYGSILVEQQLVENQEYFVFFQNAVQLLAILVERVEQEEFLNDQKAHLHHLIIEKTGHLVQQQDELNEMNEEFATMNEELVETNKSLIMANEELQKAVEALQKSKEALHENEIHFRTLADSGQALIWTSGLDKKCNYFNRPWLDFTGRKLEQELGDGWAEGVHPDDFDFCVQTYVNAFEKQERFSMEYRVLHHSGEYRWIQDDGTPRYNSRGEFLGYIGHCLDITEHKKIEHALKESEAKFRSIVNSSPNGIYFYHLSEQGQLIFTGANPAADKIIGIDHRSLLGKTMQEAFPNLANTSIPNSYSQIAKGESGAIDFEIDYIDNHVHGYYQVKAYQSSMGNLVVEFSDISARRKAEIELIESKRLLTQSQRVSGIGSYTLDIAKGFWVGSTVLDEMFGLTPSDDHSVEGWVAVIHPEDKEMMASYFANEVIGKKGRFDKTYRILPKKSKKARWVHGIGELEFDAKGNPLKMVGTIQDITYRVNAEDKLRILTRAIDQSPDSIVITNTKAEIEYINPVIEKLSGYSKEELIGKNPRIFSSGNTPPEVYKALWDNITSGKVWQGELQNRKKSGEIYWESASISPVFNSEGKITHYLAIREDITEQKKVTQELIEAKEHAEESDRLKTSFLANMSHEIRTPMNSIMGFASLLPEEESKELIGQYAQIIVRNSEQLVHIIDDIVLYSRLQTKLLSYYPSQFKVGTMFNDIKQSFNLPDYQKGVELLIDPATDVEILVNSDYEKLRQVITNLVSNAFKYTQSGSITMGVKCTDGHLLFSVKDTGIGIPASEKERVFERFYRGSNVNKAKIGGTGLGLSIVKELVELLKGKIWVESQPDVEEGSKFNIMIP
jgi:PAS domain S-box-containing protein